MSRAGNDAAGAVALRNRNVESALVFAFLQSTARSILSQQLLAAYLLLRTGANGPMGLVRALQGLVEMLASFPIAAAADHARRDRCLRVALVVGLGSLGFLAAGLAGPSLAWLLVGFALFGLYGAFTTPAMDALFADSIPAGARAGPITRKLNAMTAGGACGPFLGVGLFAYYGNQWDLAVLTRVLAVGLAVAAVAMPWLLRFDDDLALERVDARDTSKTETTRARRSAQSLRSPVFVGTEMVEVAFTEAEEPEHRPLLMVRPSSPGPTLWGRRWRLGPAHVPYLLFASDLITFHGSGMTVNFFSVFFIQEYGLAPIELNVLNAVQPAVVIVLTYGLQHWAKARERRSAFAGAERTSPMDVVIVSRCVGILCLVLMATARSLGVQLALCLLRVGLMRAPDPILRAVLMDHVPPGLRARWNALDSVVWFVFAESALLGGYVVDHHGYRACFLLASGVYALGLAVDCLVVPLTRRGHGIHRSAEPTEVGAT